MKSKQTPADRVTPLFSRRTFFTRSAQLAIATAAFHASVRLPGWLAEPLRAAEAFPFPGKENLIVRSHRFVDLETPPELFTAWITPNQYFYVRNHLATPEIHLSEWRLVVDGDVERALTLTYEDLKSFDTSSVTTVLECAGNGRALHRPRVAGIQWERGAVGNARFSGFPLTQILKKAGLKPTARHVLFDGMDRPFLQVPDFTRSIPIEKAMDENTILATHMNGEVLPLLHGFPLRVVVPGWLGAASVKWLTHIRLLQAEHDGYFMKTGYRFPRRLVTPGASVDPKDMEVITGLVVKSLIISPREGTTVRVGSTIQITGVAWAGEYDVTQVEVSSDEGKSWQRATLDSDYAKYAWRLWSFSWRVERAGVFTLLSRATDRAGRTQPLVAPWNPSGYLWNAVDRVKGQAL